MSCEECIFKGMSPREAITTNHHHRVCGHHRNPYKLTLVERTGGGGGGGGSGGGGASATPASGSQRLCVSSEHLEILTLPVLRDHCESLVVPKSGNKDLLISRLVKARIAYDMLLMDDLKDILYDMYLPVSGNKSELIARIIGRSSSAARGPRGDSAAASAAAGGGGSGSVVEARTTPITPFVGGAMIKATFRSRMEKAGRPLKRGQDVCHIISEANGGANHSDNFFIAGEAFNRSTGNRHDQLIAYIAGREAAERAVVISRAMNGYSGPNAETLYKQGEEVFRAVRAENRRNE
jgi:hypothetical protein